MKKEFNKSEISQLLRDKMTRRMGVGDLASASNEIYYQACVRVINDIMFERRKKFWAGNLSAGKKQVYYLSMEFLLGRSLRNALFSLGIAEEMEQALSEDFRVKLDDIYELEPDAGLGNGGLGRLAACYLDAAANEKYLATGYCILYEFGIFKQKIIDGWQSELPDNWLPGGEIWLTTKPGYQVEVRFGGELKEYWENDKHLTQYTGYDTVLAVPYDIHVPGYDGGMSLLRVWKARNMTGMDMEAFNRGDFAGASQRAFYGEAISKVLYPNDNHQEGKMLRLRQQYFLCSASISDICRRHMGVYGTFDNFAEKNAIHINDTHPTLAIPEMMRFLLDDCGYSWDASWAIVKGTFAYTNHTVMKEAMEVWDAEMVKALIPRIYSIITEINRRHCHSLYEHHFQNDESVTSMAILQHNKVHMANLAVVGSHCVNGVSKLHSQILKDDVFNNFYNIFPEKFTNVTNGIASRRWLLQANPSLGKLIKEAIGEDFADDMNNLGLLQKFENDTAFLDKLAASRKANKEDFCSMIKRNTGLALDPDHIFDVQVKRLHEYKRQQLNALEIIATYQYLKDNPNADFHPRTYLFGAKAAPGYFMAKQIIKLICDISKLIEADPALRKKMHVCFIEDYNVSKMEALLPASDISEQISLAGTEASGTGNMKLMLNGAITLGTMDGANVEIYDAVGSENILIFGMTAGEVETRRAGGYQPMYFYDQNPVLKRAVDALRKDFADPFNDLGDMLTRSDYYMTLADFDDYRAARIKSGELFQDKYRWQKMSLTNIAQSAVFCADRSINDYAEKIWGLK
ncbi:MAG: glycogen/starch/alpha-glucan family phosphorylase [Oscillospiraceae bacterium]|nr:glycogen/starch/alpha-glucan family phosphorylase [Oscillospiraceae bacterium]